MPAKHRVPRLFLLGHWQAPFTAHVYRNNEENANIIQTIHLSIKDTLLVKCGLYRKTIKKPLLPIPT